MKNLKVDYKNDGKKLTTYLTGVFPKLSINAVYKALRKKDIKLNGKRINDNVEVFEDDEIQVFIADDILLGISDFKVDKVYEDNNILVVNKPINVEVVGDNSLESKLGKDYDFIKACHRIDRNTIGLVVFAKNPETLDSIVDLFATEKIEKHYIACCYGIAKQFADEYAYLFKDSKKALVYVSDQPQKGAVKIHTSYKLIQKNVNKKSSLINVTLHTGRTHQIRSHLAHIGLPIIGDGKYGSYEINKRFGVSTQLLCNYSIKFIIDDADSDLAYLNNLVISLKKIPFEMYV